MDQTSIDMIRLEAVELKNFPSDYDSLLDYIGDAQIVLLGEASHGTHEFYEKRAHITQRLITEKNFNAVTIEGDWPDAYQINKYIHATGHTKAAETLAVFDRFPTWMWRNVPMLESIEWLKNYNQTNLSTPIDFYGLDIYSLYRSIDEIVRYLEKIDLQAAAVQAKQNYSCFDHYKQDPQLYSYAVFTHVIKSCAPEIIEQLRRLQEQNFDWLEQGKVSSEEAFYSEQNARVVKNAEQYYRSLFTHEENTWNLRDSHMFETVNMLIKHYQLKGIETPKIIIWAHNSHVGNAQATQMSARGEYNIGQLAKEQFGKKAVSVGFTTYEGTVSAAHDWHAPVERKVVRKALPESYEALFHATGLSNFLLILNNKKIVPEKLLERAIGVIYRPETERASHYFYANLAEQFDAVIHCDKTRAVEPLEKTTLWVQGEVPETYPSGL